MNNHIPEEMLDIIKDLVAQEEMSKGKQEEYFIELPVYSYYDYIDLDDDQEDDGWKIEIQI